MAYNYLPGLGNVGSFQVSGKPFASGGIDATTGVSVTFPAVTQWIGVLNNGNNTILRVAFSEAGMSGSNYFTVHGRGAAGSSNKTPQATVFPLKVTEIWLWGAADVDVIAGLTGIIPAQLDLVSGSATLMGGVGIVGPNWSGSAGVG